jgi:YNFM family putative membrane transporter
MAAIYLTAYYIGGSAMGWLGGHAWQGGRWAGMLAFLGVLWLACALAAARLWRLGAGTSDTGSSGST